MVNALQPELIQEKIYGQTYWLREDYKDIPPVGNTHLLLPAFDEYIIAYRNRKPVLLAEHYSKTVSSNGVFRPVIVVMGKSWDCGKIRQTRKIRQY